MCTIRNSDPPYVLNDDHRLTLTYFTTWPNLVAGISEWGKLLVICKTRSKWSNWQICMKIFGLQCVVCPCHEAIFIYMPIICKHRLLWNLDKSKPNFKYIYMVRVTWSRWLPHPYKVKIFFSQEQVTLQLSMQNRGPVLQRLCKWWSWVKLDLFLCPGKWFVKKMCLYQAKKSGDRL